MLSACLFYIRDIKDICILLLYYCFRNLFDNRAAFSEARSFVWNNKRQIKQYAIRLSIDVDNNDIKNSGQVMQWNWKCVTVHVNWNEIGNAMLKLINISVKYTFALVSESDPPIQNILRRINTVKTTKRTIDSYCEQQLEHNLT